MKRTRQSAKGQHLKILLQPLKKNARVYFDHNAKKDNNKKIRLKTIGIMPENQVDFNLHKEIKRTRSNKINIEQSQNL